MNDGKILEKDDEFSDQDDSESINQDNGKKAIDNLQGDDEQEEQDEAANSIKSKKVN